MYVDFDILPDNSRIWIYQSNRELTENEVTGINTKLKGFVNNWQRHGEDLRASFIIKYNQFIVLGVDENANDVSGCSIDSSVHSIKQLEAEFGLDLMNKLNVSFKDGDTINTVSLAEFKTFVKSKKVNKETIVFNNMVQSKFELVSNWEVPADQSWHKRFF